MQTPTQIKFSPFHLDLANEQLWRGNEPLALRPKTYSLLKYFLQRPGQLLTKDDLLETCWPETTVTDTVLKVCIREIREVLGDEPQSPRFIETAHRRGYRFIGQVEEVSWPATTSRTTASPPRLTETQQQLLALLSTTDRNQWQQHGVGATLVRLLHEVVAAIESLTTLPAPALLSPGDFASAELMTTAPQARAATH